MIARTSVFSMLTYACVAVATSMSSSYAQDAKQPAANGPTSDVSAGQTGATATPSAPSAAIGEKSSASDKFETPAVLVDDKHLESVLGKVVHSSSGETLGNVTDILVDEGGIVRAAIIDFGGFLGVGVRKIAIAWPALRFVQAKSTSDAILNMDKDQLRLAPEYHAGEPIVIIGGNSKSPQPAPQGQ